VRRVRNREAGKEAGQELFEPLDGSGAEIPHAEGVKVLLELSIVISLPFNPGNPGAVGDG
jgi:hypothetical protein